MATDDTPPPLRTNEANWRRWLHLLVQQLRATLLKLLAWGRSLPEHLGKQRLKKTLRRLQTQLQFLAIQPGWLRLPAWTRPRYFWPGLCLLQGIVLTVVLLGRPASTVDLTTSQSTIPAPPSAAATVLPWPGGLPNSQRADDFMSEGRFDLALAEYERLTPPPGRPMPPPLLYRKALALEGLGRWEEALQVYRQLTGQNNQQVRAVGQISQARLLWRLQRPRQAKVLLTQLLLRSAEPALANQLFLADARYLLALTLTAETLPTESPNPFTEAVLPHFGSDWDLARCLTWIDPVPELSTAPPARMDDYVRLHNPGHEPEESLFTIVRSDVALPPLLEQVGQLVNVQVTWSEKAHHALAEQRLTLYVADWPLVDLWRILADYLGLVWHLREGVLSWQTPDEVDAQVLRAHQRAGARRALREAILTHPNHALMASAYLELGNLAVAEGQLTEAVSWYERILREWPRSLTGVFGSYNLGQVRRRLHDGIGARQAFFRVIDQAPTHELTPLAYLWIGHSHLEEARPERALPQLRRALGMASVPETTAALAVTLAVAHLLAGEPHATLAVLHEYRSYVSRTPFRPTTAFLDSLARFRLLQRRDRRQGQQEATTLLEALLALGPDPLLRGPGQLLRGQAYEELGLRDQAIAIYRRALPDVQGALADQLTYVLAEALQAANHLQQAQALYFQLAQQNQSRWAAPARYRLAEQALGEKQPEECLRWTLQLLQAPGTIREGLILRLMGQAYDLQGDYRRAAQCYAGQRPE